VSVSFSIHDNQSSNATPSNAANNTTSNLNHHYSPSVEFAVVIDMSNPINNTNNWIGFYWFGSLHDFIHFVDLKDNTLFSADSLMTYLQVDTLSTLHSLFIVRKTCSLFI
jgi:hypothetical protein